MSNDQPTGGNGGGGTGSATNTNPVAPSTTEDDTTEIIDEDTPLSDGTDLIDDVDDSAAVTDDSADISDIEDEDVPLSDIADEDVPLAVMDEDDLTDIADDDVPLSDNPQTGDAMTLTWLGTAAAAVTGLFGAGRGKKKKDDDLK